MPSRPSDFGQPVMEPFHLNLWVHDRVAAGFAIRSTQPIQPPAMLRAHVGTSDVAANGDLCEQTGNTSEQGPPALLYTSARSPYFPPSAQLSITASPSCSFLTSIKLYGL